MDVGYAGGVLQKRNRAQADEVEHKMDNYIAEYVKQREEKNKRRQISDNSTHGRSVLGVSLHSVNYLLDSNTREIKATSLHRATSAIDLMERSSSSMRSNGGDLETSIKSEPLQPLAGAASLVQVQGGPIQESTSNGTHEGESWVDN